MDWFLDCRCWLAVAAALAVATPPSVLALPKALTAAGNAGAVATPNPRAFDDNGVSTAQYRTLDIAPGVVSFSLCSRFFVLSTVKVEAPGGGG